MCGADMARRLGPKLPSIALLLGWRYHGSVVLACAVTGLLYATISIFSYTNALRPPRAAPPPINGAMLPV